MGVVQHEVFERRQPALEPQRGAGVGKMAAFDPALPDRARPQPLVEPGDRVLGVGFDLKLQRAKASPFLQVRSLF
jgi:hypothetical protein